MKRITALSTIAVAVIALIIGRTFSASVMSNDRVMADVRQSYRSASLVVSGECIQKINSGDNAQSRILIDEVIAGNAGKGAADDAAEAFDDLLGDKGQLVRGSTPETPHERMDFVCTNCCFSSSASCSAGCLESP